MNSWSSAEIMQAPDRIQGSMGRRTHYPAIGKRNKRHIAALSTMLEEDNPSGQANKAAAVV